MAAHADIEVPVEAQRTWQRKWRDVLACLQEMEGVYNASGADRRIDVDQFTRQIEGFFKTCRELADWIEGSGNGPALAHVRVDPSAPKVCDAVAQTAKHWRRNPPSNNEPSPITALVPSLYGPHDRGVHADIVWRHAGSPDQREDVLSLVRRCIDELRAFFQQHRLDPTS
jgi:hypothetical protein